MADCGWRTGVPENAGTRGVGVGDAVGVADGSGVAVGAVVGSEVTTSGDRIAAGVATGAHATNESAIARKRVDSQFLRHIGDAACSS